MRKVILNLAISLDGLIEGPNGEFDWCFTDQDYGMTEFLESVDTIVFGRKSYELMLRFEADPYPGKNKYVFSRSLKTEAPQTNFVTGDVAEIMNQIQQQPGKDIWLFGGADLTTAFLNANLIDELQLSIHPIVLGQGKPLFVNIAERKYFRLTNTKTYESGLLQAFYERVDASSGNV
ncbi:MAG: dihydrofolate reductase family protein [Adhaeribacter sp.]